MCKRHERGRIPHILVVGLSVLLASAVWAAQSRLTIQDGRILMCLDDTVLAQYHFSDVPFKPYIEKLFTPDGVNVLLDSPLDHVHHHGLMLALAVDGINCWEETPTAGHQQHEGLVGDWLKKKTPASSVGFTERVRWADAEDRPLLDERRTIKVRRTETPKAVMLTWNSLLSVPEGKASVTLSGSHYFGLGMRFIRSMDNAGPFVNADGKPGTVFGGQERLVRSNWCAYTAQADGKEVTVAMFGHPENPRHPTTWFTMAEPFAYLAATLGLHEEPLVLPAEKPLNLRYGVALCDGVVEAKDIEVLHRQWLESLDD